VFQKFREGWVRPALFFGNNPISLAGGAITTASGVTMIAYWLVEILWPPQRQSIPRHHLFLLLPGLFIAGLALIPDRRAGCAAESCKRPGRFRPNFPKSI